MRDWAGVASRAADYPPIVASCFHPEYGSVTPAPFLGDATLAMQEALSSYLSALSTLSADGVLTHREDPFVGLAVRAGAASEAGGLAVDTLGSLLRRAEQRNARAPQLGEIIVDSDGSVQALIAAMRKAVRDAATSVAEERRSIADIYRALEDAATDPFSRRALLDVGVMRDRDYATAAAARTNYGLVLARIAEGHALLKANASRLSQEETARSVRAAEDALRRAADLLPRALSPMPAGTSCAPPLPPGNAIPPADSLSNPPTVTSTFTDWA
ncbi:hypothetical protein ACLF3G_23340 [Falsiroseomonas sp. HC035]|uniref:hypothetical protein n=1 Tax=Falsiroseomonas sp. HC035 TaxID=3390999 RepID=UPI003D321C58